MTIGTTRCRFVGPEPMTPEITTSFGLGVFFGRRLAVPGGAVSLIGRPVSSAILMFCRPRARSAAV